jgi:SAM-dependent methyltransferase
MNDDLTRVYYEQNASAYAGQTLPMRLDQMWSTFSNLLQPGAYVLDLGCGSGRDLKELALRGFRVIGLEYSQPLAELAQKYSREKVLVGDMRVFEFGVEKFDGIWAVASLLHIPRKEMSGLLRKLYDALQPKGILLTSMKNGEGIETAPDGRLFEFYQPHEWELMLKKAGFEVEGHQASTEKRQTASGNARQIEWFVSVARKTS